jgi:hypothetical protein
MTKISIFFKIKEWKLLVQIPDIVFQELLPQMKAFSVSSESEDEVYFLWPSSGFQNDCEEHISLFLP